MKRYSELIKLTSFEDRFNYLKIGGKVGAETFGHDRYLNQVFYTSPEWRKVRQQVIIRDNGCDMALEDYEIQGRIMIHHLNPIVPKDILLRKEMLLDPENLVCVSYDTHNALHYGDISLAKHDFVERRPNDMAPWKK